MKKSDLAEIRNKTAKFKNCISVNLQHTVGLKTDGTVVAAGGSKHGLSFNRGNTQGWQGVAAVFTGLFHTIGLKADGTVVAVIDGGYFDRGQCDVQDWQDIKAIAASDYHTAGLKKDGTVVTTGLNDDGQCNTGEWRDIKAICTGKCSSGKEINGKWVNTDHGYTVGLKTDGTAVAVGYNENGQCNVGEWCDIEAISVGTEHTVGLKKDGTVVAVGANHYGACNTEDWQDIVDILAYNSSTYGLKSDGTVVGCGTFNAAIEWQDIAAIAATCSDLVGLKADGTVVALGGDNVVNGVGKWQDITAIFAGQTQIVGLKADGKAVEVGGNDYGQKKVTDWYWWDIGPFDKEQSLSKDMPEFEGGVIAGTHAVGNANKSIFISSTFRDMQAERDALRDFVLPKVNEFAAKYGCAVEIIDLRWGVDTEEEQSLKVLRTCLDEIERCRPFFLGLIGDRYGWIPPHSDIKMALEANEFPLDDLNMSVTALEIEFGALHSKNQPICLFYFRESFDYASMPEELRSIYQDEAEGRAKLAKLKEKIRARFVADIKNYAAKIQGNELTVSKEWADMVANDIIKKLRQEWGELSNTPPDWKEQERNIQKNFRESRTLRFAGRSTAIEELSAFCLSEETGSQILIMQGEAGSGKSALLCKTMDEIENKCLLLPFCCGLSSRSSLVANMLRYFISLLCEELDLEIDSDSITEFQDLKDRFMELLLEACKKKRVVLVADALDQLIGSDEARRLLWINGRLPKNFRLLCSIIDGPEIEAAKRLGAEVRPVPSISEEDKEAIILNVAMRHHKQISSEVAKHILERTPETVQATQNPLYLSLIVQDLVNMDRYEFNAVEQYKKEKGLSHGKALAEFMKERINEMPKDPEGMYLAILGRLEKLIEPDFIRGVCGMIAVSRNGLRESDLKGAFKELKMDFNPADFSWLRQMLRGHISQGDAQQWNYSHQSLRLALKKNRPGELKQLNNGIVANFIKTMSQDSFVAREIMHHLCAADRPDWAAKAMVARFDTHCSQLAQGLADIYMEHAEGSAFLLAIPGNAKGIEKKDIWRIAATICNLLPLLPENTHAFRIELMLAVIAMLEKQEDDSMLWVKTYCEGIVADLYTETGDNKNAGKYHQKALNANEHIYGKTGFIEDLKYLAASYSKMADYLMATGDSENAGRYYQKALNANEHIYGKSNEIESLRVEPLRDLAILYGKMGDYLMATGSTTKAGYYYYKSIEASQQACEHFNTVATLSGVSSPYYKSMEANLAGKQINAVTLLVNLSDSHEKKGHYLTALGLTKEAGEYYRRSLDERFKAYAQSNSMKVLSGLAKSYDYMGNHLMALGQTQEAGEYHRKALEARTKIYEQTGTESAQNELAKAYRCYGKSNP